MINLASIFILNVEFQINNNENIYYETHLFNAIN
jgi:hypothetical protein